MQTYEHDQGIGLRRFQWLSTYQGESHYRVEGLPGRVEVRPLMPRAQGRYPVGAFDPALAGTVTNGCKPVPDDVLEHFRQEILKYQDLPQDIRASYRMDLTTAKWYPGIGWVRCEPGLPN